MRCIVGLRTSRTLRGGDRTIHRVWQAQTNIDCGSRHWAPSHLWSPSTGSRNKDRTRVRQSRQIYLHDGPSPLRGRSKPRRSTIDNNFSINSCICRRSQDFVWRGSLFSSKKLTTFFLNKPQNLSRPAKTVLKLILALPEVQLVCWRVQLQMFPVNYAWIFSPPWGCRCTHFTPCYDYGCTCWIHII